MAARGRTSSIYRRHFYAGRVNVPAADGRHDAGFYAVPHVSFVRSADGNTVTVGGLAAGLGGKTPALAAGANPLVKDLEPGHFVLNCCNFNSLAGFLRHMPWESTVVKIDEGKYDDRRRLAFEGPDGRVAVLISN